MATPLKNTGVGNVWVVKKPYNDNLYSISHPLDRTAVMSFVDKRQAVAFVNMVAQMTKPMDKLKRPYDKTVVDHMPLDYLKRTCAVASLDLCLVYKDGDVERIKLEPEHPDDVVFHFENAYKYAPRA